MPKLIDVPNQGQVEFPDDMSDADIVAAIKKNLMNYPAKAAKQPTSLGLSDRLKAGAAGVNKGFFSDLVGLPVDTATNVIDLAKAGIGYGASKITGKAPPSWTEPSNRENVFGSADWIAKNINKGSSSIGMQSPIDNPNPQDSTSRILYSGGRVAGASVVPSPTALISGRQQLGNAGMGALSGILAGSTAEVSPEYSGVAGMLPSLAAAGAISATKRSVRGGEAGRREMEQRIQDLKNAGVDTPSVGLASGNKMIAGIENILAQTPLSSSLFEKSRNNMLKGMGDRTNSLRRDISPEYGAVGAGEAIQADLKGLFKDRIGNTYTLLNDKVSDVVGANTSVPVTEAIAKSRQLATPIPGAEQTSSLLIQPKIRNINDALTVDAGINGGVMLEPGMRRVQTDRQSGIPFSALKELRTKIGKESQSNAIMGTPEQAEFKQLYGAMSQDMKNGVSMADIRNGIDPSSAASATTALNRANKFYSNAMNRADQLNPLANRSTPEGAFNAVSKSLESGPTTYSRLRGAISPDTRNKIAATIIDELGSARAANQNATRDAWSPNTFFTNYNKLYENGGGEALFKRLPGGKQHAENLADIAKAAEMINSSSKVWSNPSGTAPAVSARAALGTIVGGVLMSPFVAGALPAATAAASGLAASNGMSRLLLNPKFAAWLAKAPSVRPQETQSYIQRLIATAKLTGDKQFQEDVSQYISELDR